MVKSVKIDELEKALGILFERLKEDGIDSFDLNEDYYWHVNKEQIYDPYRKPENLTLGQLYDDLEVIQSINNREVDIVWTEAKAIAALLRYFSDINPYISPK